MPHKLVLVVRTDLEMGRGKAAAQAAHAAVTATLRTLGAPATRTWLDEGQPKVVLKVGGEDGLRAVCAAAGKAGLPVHVIRDAGRTQIDPGTVTCCAIGPADTGRIDLVTGGLALL